MDPDETSRLFKRPGERLLLWKMLEAENPWAISGQVARRHRWARIAEKIMKPCYLVVYEQGGGKTTKKLDVCKNSVRLRYNVVNYVMFCGRYFLFR